MKISVSLKYTIRDRNMNREASLEIPDELFGSFKEKSFDGFIKQEIKNLFSALWDDLQRKETGKE